MPQTFGRLTVITGPMFSGKTTRLLSRIDRARRQKMEVLAATHAIDDRFGRSLIASHSGASSAAAAVGGAGELIDAVQSRRPQLLALDEAQFFDADLVGALDEVLAAGTDVVVAGLCLGFAGDPIEPVTALMTSAEDVVKLTAVCETCGADAVHHQLLDPTLARNGPIVGGAELYEARCREHFKG